VIAVDTNILIHAHREDSPFHDRAAACLTGLATGRQAWAIPWPCIHEFFSTATHTRYLKPPTPAPLALAQLDAWLESPSLVLLCESPLHWATLRRLLISSQIVGPVVHDARIAALCQQHAVRELWTADRDFKRFPALRTRNPLVGV
jgi:toxin-antitoxin system PIN domain toxin